MDTYQCDVMVRFGICLAVGPYHLWKSVPVNSLPEFIHAQPYLHCLEEVGDPLPILVGSTIQFGA